MSMSKRLREEEEQEKRWTEGLQEHILQLIPKRLCISDFQLFRQVCPIWRAAIDTGMATKTCFPAPQPWLLLRKAYDSLDGFSINNQISCVRDLNVFPSIHIGDHPAYPPNLDDKKSLDISNIVFSTASLAYLGSIGSWLIVAADKQYENACIYSVVNFFLNPVTRTRVMLPSQSTLKYSHKYTFSTTFFKKFVASSPPGQQEQDCVVAALTRPGFLAFCRPNDAEWTLIESNKGFPGYRDIEIFDGKLYVVTEGINTMLKVFDMAPEVANVTRAQRLIGECPLPFADQQWRYPCLAKDSASNDLFVVLRQRNIKGFRVYKTNDKIDRPDGMRWELVTDLADRILFLGDQSSRVINDKTLGKNCIYFAFIGSWNGGLIGVYDLKDSSLNPLHFPEDYSSTASDGSISQSLWFTPYPW